jgi:hypothetical protein
MHNRNVNVGQAFIAMAGPVGANKRKFSDLIGEIVKSPTARFSDYLKKVADRNGIRTSYQALQDLGMDVIAEQGWPGFCHNVLRNVGSNTDAILVDGLRHVLAFTHLQDLSRPYNLFVVYVDVTRDEQFENLRSHDVDSKDIPSILMHPVEEESTLIRRVADVIIKDDTDARRAAAYLEELMAKKAESDRAELRRKSGLNASAFEAIASDFERFASLRAVVRLLGPFDEEAIRKWLNTPQYELHKRTPIETLKEGEPEAAVRSAIRFAEI